MKILVFGDNHGDLLSLSVAKEKAKDADYIVCLGDITWFGDDLEPLMAFINTFPKKVLMIHGNHEFEELVRAVSNQHNNIQFAHGEVVKVGDWNFITYGGDGFSREDHQFEKFFKKIAKTIDFDKTILVLHGPPIDTELDIPFPEYHSGSMSYRKAIEEHQPLLVVAGHIHECEKKSDYIKDTLVNNPGPDGELFDLEILHKKRKEKLNTN